MKQEDIIRMAIDAVGGDMNGQDVQHLAWRLKHFKDDSYRFGPDELLKFVAMIEAAERDACAKVCDDIVAKYGSDVLVDWFAKDIRARGES